MPRILLTFALSLAFSLPASAQQLKLAFNGGLVSLEATSVPVRTILVEWGRLGGTKVIGAERIAGNPLTLKLENVPESQALEIVLRSVAGYMAAPRRASAVAGASIYDRILVMATSAVPAPTRPTPAPGGNAGPGNQRFTPPRPPVLEVEERDEPEEEPDPNPPNPPVFTFPQPGNGQPTFAPSPATPPSITINPATNPGSVPAVGSPMPGMISPPLPPPGTLVRPPGGA